MNWMADLTQSSRADAESLFVPVSHFWPSTARSLSALEEQRNGEWRYPEQNTGMAGCSWQDSG
jgi:hypothetical protein